MAAPKLISELTQVGTLAAADVVPVMQGGTTYYATAAQFITDAASFAASGTGAVSRTVSSKFQDTVSLLDFIPVAEHAAIQARSTTTDLSTYIQAAIDAVNAKGGGRIWVPEGLYLCNSVVLKNYVLLEGERSGPRNAYASGGNSQTVVSNANTKGSAFRQYTDGDVFTTTAHPTTTSGAGLKDLVISGKSGATSGRGVYLSQGTFFCSVERCCITHFPRQGLVTGGTANHIELNFIGWNGQYQVSSLTFYEGNIEVYGTDHSVIQNEVHGPLDYSTYDGEALANASGYAVACLVQAASCFISRNVFEIADAGLVLISRHTGKTSASGKLDPYYPVTCRANNITGNRIDTQLGHGLVLIATDSFTGPRFINVVGNWIESCGRQADDTYSGIYVAAGGANYPINNNIVANQVINSTAAGNDVKYGINTKEAQDLQAAHQIDNVEGNRVDPSSFVTAAYNGNPIDTYTGTLTGFASPPTGTVRFFRQGKNVTLYIPLITGTSNAATCTLTGAPVVVRPTRTQEFMVAVTDNGTNAVGWGSMASNGTLTLAPTVANSASGWTNSGTKAIRLQTINYSLE